jgi:hypothetical protein
MCLPHRNNPPRVAKPGPDNHDQPSVQKSGADEPGFPVILPFISQGCVAALKDGAGIREIQPAMRQWQGALGRIEADTDLFM